MKRIHTLVIGAGQAGLAMSHCLTERTIPHVVLEHGDVANSWKAERWDSLRLLTPNWQSRLPGHVYAGPDPDGFMSMPDVIRFLETYAVTSKAPVETGVRVFSLTAAGFGYRVTTNKGSWQADHVVIATGAYNIASIPGFAQAIPPHIAQLTPIDYKSPAQLHPGGVLVVGGSATGVQLASELRQAGYDVILSTGEHIRMPRHYRGRDIQWWMDATGLHATPIAQVDDIDRVRRLPSLQLAGWKAPQIFDLNALQALGVEITGRLATVQDGVAKFSGALTNHCALSDLKMNRLLNTLDTWAETSDAVGLCASADTVIKIAADPKHLGARVGVTSVLHTWGSAMTHHPHVHMIVPGGGLSADCTKWIACRRNFFLSVRVLSRLYRHLILDGLTRLHNAGMLQFFGNHAELKNRAAFRAFLQPLSKIDWVVYAKEPFAGPKAVLAYLSRYTHRIAISNSRLIRFNADSVTFKVKNYRVNGAGRRTIMTLKTDEFVRRFLIHVLPKGQHRIRHYGFYGNGNRAANIARIRELLGAKPPSRQAAGDANGGDTDQHPRVLVLPCPCCGGRLIIVDTFAPSQHPRAPPASARAAA